MDGHKDVTKKQMTKSKQTVNLKKVLQIVEGGFNTQEINSAFDFNEYDLLSSEDDSLTSEIGSDDGNESGTDEDAVIVLPTLKRRKSNTFDKTNKKNPVSTCTKCVEQHAHLTSGINQSHISELSVRPIFNAVNADSTSPLQHTVQPDDTHEHDKLNSLNNFAQPEPVFIIPLDIEPASLTPEPHIQNSPPVQIQDDQLDSENTTGIENPNSPVPNDRPNSPVQPLNQHLPNHYLNNIESPSEDDYYIIEDYRPSPPPENNNLLGTQIVNCQGDAELEEDVENGWHRITNDLPPDNPQFTDILGLNFDTQSCEPEIFFNQLFDQRMLTIIADKTNNYARQQIAKIMGGRDEIQQIEHYSHKRHARLGTWRDVNESDIKIFTAHLLVMSSVKKPALHNYWSTNSLSRTPFLAPISVEINSRTFCGTYM